MPAVTSSTSPTGGMQPLSVDSEVTYSPQHTNASVAASRYNVTNKCTATACIVATLSLTTIVLLIVTIMYAVRVHNANARIDELLARTHFPSHPPPSPTPSVPPSTPSTPSQTLMALARDIDGVRNVSADPCSDFYAYACGQWLQRTVIPADQSAVSRSFTSIADRNRHVLQSIIAANWPLITPFYDTCMDTHRMTSAATQPLQQFLQLFDVSAYPSSSIPELMYYIGRLQRKTGISPLFTVDVSVNDLHPTQQWLSLGQSGLSFRSSTYYHNTTLMPFYAQHIINMLMLTNQSYDTATSDAASIIAFETSIANFTIRPDQLRDPHTVYNPFNLTYLNEISPLTWQSWLFGVDLPFNTTGTLVAPSYFTYLAKLIITTPMPVVLAHIRWHILHHFANDIGDMFSRENFRFFGQIVRGQRQERPRRKSCIAATVNQFSDMTGRLFVQHSLSDESRVYAQEMISAIRQTMRNTLESSVSWMDPTTRQLAMIKLSLIEDLVGGPLNFSDYNGVSIDRSVNYVTNLLQITQYNINKTFNKLHAPTDKHDWEMSASAVNAYYEPTLNTINFPAGILQRPFFDSQWPLTVNIAGIGMIISHELTHGFDDQGRLYDGHGRLHEWFTQSSIHAFTQQTQCLVRQYHNMSSAITPISENINGRLTLGENIADNAGLHLAFLTHQRISSNNTVLTPAIPLHQQRSIPPTTPPMTDDQLFFVSFAQSWCTKRSAEYEKILLLSDVHSPPFARVNGPLMNLPEFANAFHCASATTMNPHEKCRVY